MTVEDRRRLLNAFDAATPLQLRTWCMVAMMLDCGLRAAEMCALRLEDIDWHDGTVWVRQGKGAKDRTIPKGAIHLLPILRRWRTTRPGPANDQAPLFPARSGYRMSTRNLRDLLARWARRARCHAPRVHPHMLRHVYATELLRSAGGNIAAVQAAMGHADLRTTQRYLHTMNPELARIGAAMRRRTGAAHRIPRDKERDR